MERPTITIEGKTYEMLPLIGRSWRILGEFADNTPNYTDADFIEKHAAFIANFFHVTADEILDKMSLEEILPATIAVRSYVINALTAKIAAIEKNSEAVKEQ